mmetsp:Transcript_14576/g.40066  ORF Transcript_14576/g.40066 Transcript_14576/m.40066 type:complete len:318 (+) Transcript_14576:51-1004(+)
MASWTQVFPKVRLGAVLLRLQECQSLCVKTLLDVNVPESPPPAVGARYSLPVTEQAQNMQEKVDDVKVQCQGRVHVVVNRKLILVTAPLSEDELCVVDDEHREEHDSEDVVAHVRPLDRHTHARHDHQGEAKDAQNDQCSEEIGPHSSEVGLGHACVQSHRQKDQHGDTGGEEDALPRVPGAGEAHHSCHACGEAEEKQVVRGVPTANVFAAHEGAHHDQRGHGTDRQDPTVAVDPLRTGELNWGRDRDGEQQLHGKKPIDLAHEADANVGHGMLYQSGPGDCCTCEWLLLGINMSVRSTANHRCVCSCDCRVLREY